MDNSEKNKEEIKKEEEKNQETPTKSLESKTTINQSTRKSKGVVFLKNTLRKSTLIRDNFLQLVDKNKFFLLDLISIILLYLLILNLCLSLSGGEKIESFFLTTLFALGTINSLYKMKKLQGGNSFLIKLTSISLFFLMGIAEKNLGIFYHIYAAVMITLGAFSIYEYFLRDLRKK